MVKPLLYATIVFRDPVTEKYSTVLSSGDRDIVNRVFRVIDAATRAKDPQLTQAEPAGDAA